MQRSTSLALARLSRMSIRPLLPIPVEALQHQCLRRCVNQRMLHSLAGAISPRSQQQSLTRPHRCNRQHHASRPFSSTSTESNSTSASTQPPKKPFDYIVRRLDNDVEIERQLPLTYSLAARRARRHENGLSGTVFVKQRKTTPPVAVPQATIKTKEQQQESKHQSEIAQCTPSDSYVRLVLPFTSSSVLRSRYQLFDTNLVRVGIVLEDCDALAADVAYRHVALARGIHTIDSLHTVTIVTLGMDRLAFHDRMTIDSDLVLESTISWVGKSSIEVQVELSSLSPEIDADSQGASTRQRHSKPIGKATFVMVARDVVTYKASPVPPLSPQLPSEQSLFTAGALNRQRRQSAAQRSLFQTPPREDESAEIHALYLADRDGAPFYQGAPCVRQSDTQQKATMLAQSQERNIHNKMFGGALMREAYELAWLSVNLTTRGRVPVCLQIENVRFMQPVGIGSVTSFQSRLLCSDVRAATVQVHVDAKVIDPSSGQRQTTNEFHFAFKCLPHDHGSDHGQVLIRSDAPNVVKTVSSAQHELIPFIMPQTYGEMMLYLDGRRREVARQQVDSTLVDSSQQSKQ